MAAAPATCGQAIEVPLMESNKSFEDEFADAILDPGAKMSTQFPKLLK
jgi:hypothetical protein